MSTLTHVIFHQRLHFSLLLKVGEGYIKLSTHILILTAVLKGEEDSEFPNSQHNPSREISIAQNPLNYIVQCSAFCFIRCQMCFLVSNYVLYVH